MVLFILDSDVSVLYFIKQNYLLNHLVILFSTLQENQKILELPFYNNEFVIGSLIRKMISTELL